MKILILEDSKDRQHKFLKSFSQDVVAFVETVEQAKLALLNDHWDAIFLDHDLGGQVFQQSREGTGFEIAQWLSDRPMCKPNLIFLHSLNELGRANMKKLLPEAIEFPFAWEQFDSCSLRFLVKNYLKTGKLEAINAPEFKLIGQPEKTCSGVAV